MAPHTPSPSQADYTVLSRLGSADGNFNAGLHLVQGHTSRLYAVRKTFKPKDISQGYALREIRTLKQLQHGPNIVAYKGAFLSPNGWDGALFTAFYPYGDLLHLIERYQDTRRVFPESFLWHVFSALSSAIAYLSEGDGSSAWNWIVHRDIWPANILVGSRPMSGGEDAYPSIVIADFGSAVSKLDVQCGRHRRLELRQQPDFKVPGVDRAEVVDRRSDVYQVGINLVAMGRLDLEPAKYRERFKVETVGMGYSEALNALVRKCLLKESRLRIAPGELRARVTEQERLRRGRGRGRVYLRRWVVDAGGRVGQIDVVCGS